MIFETINMDSVIVINDGTKDVPVMNLHAAIQSFRNVYTITSEEINKDLINANMETVQSQVNEFVAKVHERLQSGGFLVIV